MKDNKVMGEFVDLMIVIQGKKYKHMEHVMIVLTIREGRIIKVSVHQINAPHDKKC